MNDKIQIKTAGDRPATGYFFLRRQEKVTKKKATPVCRPSGSLDQPQASGAAQLALAGRTPRAPLRNSNNARLNLRLLVVDRGGAQGKKKRRPKIVKSLGGQLIAHQSKQIQHQICVQVDDSLLTKLIIDSISETVESNHSAPGAFSLHLLRAFRTL